MPEPVDPSAPPLRERGTRARAGNAMARTRTAVLDGAARAVEKHGARRTTMGDIATLAGIAKATIYNHFRTKEDVYRAAVDAGIRELGRECAQLAASDLAEALARAADRLAGHAALRRVAVDEPALIAGFVLVADDGAWVAAREAATEVLRRAGRAAGAGEVDAVLRWVGSHAVSPGTAATRASGAAVLAAGLGQAHETPEL